MRIKMLLKNLLWLMILVLLVAALGAMKSAQGITSSCTTRWWVAAGSNASIARAPVSCRSLISSHTTGVGRSNQPINSSTIAARFGCAMTAAESLTST